MKVITYPLLMQGAMMLKCGTLNRRDGGFSIEWLEQQTRPHIAKRMMAKGESREDANDHARTHFEKNHHSRVRKLCSRSRGLLAWDEKAGWIEYRGKYIPDAAKIKDDEWEEMAAELFRLPKTRRMKKRKMLRSPDREERIARAVVRILGEALTR